MKNLVTKKQATRYESVDNLHHCIAFSTQSLVQKKDDLGAFTIPCAIRALNFDKALCDLGASIRLMPFVIYKKLGMRDPTSTNMRLVMADKSVKRTVGILHDVLVKVADFKLPANFVVLDCEVNFEVTIILGRPFFVTGRVIVDMELNEMKFRINDKEERFKIHSSMTQKRRGVFSQSWMYSMKMLKRYQ
ncbi:uncharacterized protein LOC124887144 [Capsicum annuum]|uniref:uncharacterized protein LOC124887144 n=1 Tax=Capsicum annuum TaxID=4072 RepID=UPI001FB18D88|nr:uncharacterized protein LOC124887144 [Capsicum annuum]